MGLVGISEYSLMEFFAIREPYVRRLLIKRSAWILVLTIAIGPCPPVLPVPALRGPDSEIQSWSWSASTHLSPVNGYNTLFLCPRSFVFMSAAFLLLIAWVPFFSL